MPRWIVTEHIKIRHYFILLIECRRAAPGGETISCTFCSFSHHYLPVHWIRGVKYVYAASYEQLSMCMLPHMTSLVCVCCLIWPVKYVYAASWPLHLVGNSEIHQWTNCCSKWLNMVTDFGLRMQQAGSSPFTGPLLLWSVQAWGVHILLLSLCCAVSWCNSSSGY